MRVCLCVNQHGMTAILVSFITVMFYVDYLYFTDSFVFHCVFFVTVLIDVLIYSAAQLQERLINLLTYLLLCIETCNPACTDLLINSDHKPKTRAV